MSVNLIFKIAAVGILVTVIGQVLKHSGREEHAFLTSLAGLIIVLFWIVPYIYELFETMQSLFAAVSREKTMDIVKIAVLGIAGVFLAIPLKREKGEYSTFVAMVVGICIFIYLLTKVETVLLFVDSIKSQLPVDSRYIGLVVKMVGITYVSEFAANLCRDSGYSAIAGQIEMFAKLSILVVSVPVFGAFLDAVGSFL